MKITKSQLKQIIKEELEESWISEMEKVVLSAQELFRRLPQEAKPHFIKSFEMHMKYWKGEDNNVEDLDFDPSGGL